MTQPAPIYDAILDILDEKRDSLVPAQQIAAQLGVDTAVVEGYLDLLEAEGAVVSAKTFGGHDAMITPAGTVKVYERKGPSKGPVAVPGSTRGPHEEATELLRECAVDLASQNFALETSLMAALRAAYLLGWEEQAKSLYAELNGYAAQVPVPWYRLAWLTTYDLVVSPFGGTPASGQGTMVNSHMQRGFPLREPVHNLIRNLQVGIEISRGDVRSIVVEGQVVFASRVEQIAASEISGTLAAIRQHYYALASWWLAGLQRRAAAGDFLDEYRSLVDRAVAELGIAANLRAAIQTLRPGDPEGCRQTAFAIRHTLTELSRSLWRMQDDYYGPLELKLKGVPGLEPVKNKLRAWLHQKGARKEGQVLVEKQLIALADQAQALYDMASATAKGTVSYEDVRSCMLALYVFLGEIALRTDLKPVEKLRAVRASASRKVGDH
jgi:predicted transcriptional regulator